MRVVNNWKDAPASVNLGIVLGYFGYNQEYRCEKQRESNDCNERVRGDIDLFESFDIRPALDQSRRKGYEL